MRYFYVNRMFLNNFLSYYGMGYFYKVCNICFFYIVDIFIRFSIIFYILFMNIIYNLM